MADAHSATEQGLVRLGWELVDVLGKLGSGKSLRLLQERWDAERERAAAELKPLETGDVIPPSMKAAYEGPSNWTRYRRTLDFVRPGDRLLEIGIGYGYLAGMFLREGGLEAYRGFDLEEHNVRSTRATLKLNGLDDRAQVDQGDLYDLTRETVEEFGASLLVCCEVIEHVPDPEKAVQTLADALPDGCDLLISVPLLGRLEGVWGHLAIFDAARVRQMVESAGLVPHTVDVVDNTWVFVLASKEAGASARAAAAAALPVSSVGAGPSDPEMPRALRSIDLESAGIGPSRWNKRLANAKIEHRDGEIRCQFTGNPGDDATASPYGGLKLPVRSPRGIRIELDLEDIEGVDSFYVDAYAGEKRVARWKWEPAQRRPKNTRAIFVLRPGLRGLNFRPLQIDDNLSSADAFDIFAKLQPGASTRFRLTRASLIVGETAVSPV